MMNCRCCWKSHWKNLQMVVLVRFLPLVPVVKAVGMQVVLDEMVLKCLPVAFLEILLVIQG